MTKFLKRHQCGLSSRTKSLLDKEGRTTNNLILDGDTEALVKALDHKWDGGTPYTFLVGPEGKILFSHSGEIEPRALKKAIVKQVWESNAE